MPRAPIAAEKRKSAESLLGAGKSINEVAKTVGIGVATASKIKAELSPSPASANLPYIDPDIRSLARPIGDLNPDPANARKHPDRNLDAIKSSLARFGQKKPVVARPVNGNLIVVAGNGTLAAAKALGWTHMAVSVKEMSDAEATAYGIADNKTAELAEWDDEVLAGLLGSLDADLQSVTGFDDAEIQALISDAAGGTDGLTDPDDVPEQPPAITQRGDVWLMGQHRLICGDSTNAVDVNRVMRGEKADLVLTDPPYGVDYVGKTAEALEVKNDDAEGLPQLLELSLGLAAKQCRAGAVWYVAAPPGPQHLHFGLLLRQMEILRQTLIWVKDSMVLGHSDYHYKHETIYYGWMPNGKRVEPPTRDKTSVLEFSRPKASREHPTMKPIELWCELMANSTASGSLAYEPFSGSGSTIIAAEKLGRRCFAIEIEPRYVDVAVQRWCNFTGKDATRESDGAKWSELSGKPSNG